MNKDVEQLLMKQLEVFKQEMVHTAEQTIKDLYCDVLPYVLSDAEQNMANIVSELLQKIIVGDFEVKGNAVTLAADIRKLLDQPADQHQGEPVTLPEAREVRTSDIRDEAYDNGWNTCLDEIAKLGPLYSRPVQGEPVVPAFVMPSSENSYGFGYVDGSCIQSLRGYRDHLEGIVDSIPEGPLYTHVGAEEVERLRAQLAEAQALLREIADRIKSVMPRHAAEVLAILSASAEPSAPVERDGAYVGRAYI